MNKRTKKAIILAVLTLAFTCLILTGRDSVISRGAVEEDRTLYYSLEESVWYQLQANREMELKTPEGLSQTVYVGVQADENGIVITSEASGKKFIITGSRLSGIYAMVCEGELYFAAELWDEEGNLLTWLWGMQNDKFLNLPGRLEKKNGCIQVRNMLLGGYESLVTVTPGDWTQVEVVTLLGSCTYMLTRPLHLVPSAALRQDCEPRILPAGTWVEFSQYKTDSTYEWYGIKQEDGIWWLSLCQGQLALQEGEFTECFVPVNASTSLYVNPNRKWRQPQEDFCTFYGTGKWLLLSDYTDIFEEDVLYIAAEGKEITMGIIDFDPSQSTVFVAVQYPQFFYENEVWARHVCRLYRLVGNWLVPIWADGYENGELPVRLFAEEVDWWSEGYSDEPVSQLEHNGTIQIEGRRYQLQGQNQLVEMEASE